MRAAWSALLLAGGLGCGEWTQSDGFTEEDWKVIRSMELTSELPVDPSNRLLSDFAAVTLGQQLFFDWRLSQPHGVSCADCHDPTAWFIDTRSKPNNLSVGVQPLGMPDGERPPAPLTRRNSGSLVNVARYNWWGWDGRSDTLWMQAAVAYESPRTMSGSRARMAQVMYESYAASAGGLSPELHALLSTRPSGHTFNEMDGQPVAAVGYKALAAYMQRLGSPNAPIDRFARGEEQALSEPARKGLKLFIGKAGCIECHAGPAFNGVGALRQDEEYFRSVAIAQRGPGVDPVDKGRTEGVNVLLNSAQSVFNTAGFYNDAPGLNRIIGLQPSPTNDGKFRIKSLRQIAKTAPYMHAGQLATLGEVVHFYNTGGDIAGYSGERDRVLAPLGLTDDEERHLVAFLEALTGEPVPLRLACDLSREPRRGSPLCDGSTAP